MSRKYLVPLVLPADPAAAMEAATKQYVDARALSEVEISATDPIGTNPAAELWVDTSAAASKMPLGYVTSVVVGSGDQNFSLFQWNDIVGATVTWTATATRRYKTTLKVSVGKLTNPGDVYVGMADGAGNAIQTVVSSCPAANYYNTISFPVTESGLSGSVTRKLRVFPFTDGVRVVASGGEYVVTMLVEDIGGV